MPPTISVVTITFNSERFLEDTMASVAAQTYDDLEYVIVDGGSTDGTLDIVRRYEQHVDQMVSEPDGGIGDAMNKGAAMANGDFVLFLHSDDYLLDGDSLAKVAPHLETEDDIVAFRLYYEEVDGTRRLPRVPKLDWRINFKMSLDHQAVFVRTSFHRDLGGFDPSVRIAMDYDFFLRAYRGGARAVTHDLPMAVMRKVGVSARQDRETLLARFREEKMVHERYAGNIARRLIYGAYWVAYPIYRGFRPWEFRGTSG